jgi:hypothetical protein
LLNVLAMHAVRGTTMPGTTRGELYEMALSDALAILLSDDTLLAPLGDDDADELKRAARWVISAHAVDVVGSYLAPRQRPSLKVVR